MTSSGNLLRLAATATLTVALLPGCTGDDPPALTKPKFLEAGVGPNCYHANPVVLPEWTFDIDADGRLDWFVVYRCPATTKPTHDQLEVFDGAAPFEKPRRLGSWGPLIHPEDGITIAEGGCLMFTRGAVFVGDQPAGSGPGWHVTRVGTWLKDKVQMTEPAKDTTIPCTVSRPARP